MTGSTGTLRDVLGMFEVSDCQEFLKEKLSPHWFVNSWNAFDRDKTFQRNLSQRGDPWGKNKQRHKECKKKPAGLGPGT